MFQQLFANIGSNFDVSYVGYIFLFPFVFLWVWSILYVTRDISHRTDNILYQLFSILLVFFLTPIVGLPLYFIFRPVRLQDDIVWRKSLEILSNECLDCNTLNHKDNNFCISCGVALKIECKECKNKYYIGYDYCPHCGAPNLDSD